MKSHQSGFAPIVTLVILIAVIGIGFGGYHAIVNNKILGQFKRKAESQAHVALNQQVSSTPTTTQSTEVPVTSTTLDDSEDEEYVVVPGLNPTASQISTSTITWKGYTNRNYGFAFSYPAEWSVINIQDSTTNIVQVIDPESDSTMFLVREMDATGCENKNIEQVCLYSDTERIVITTSATDAESRAIVEYMLSTFRAL